MNEIILCTNQFYVLFILYRFEGLATLMQGRSKMLTVLVVVLSDCLFFLQESSHKYTFFNPENKVHTTLVNPG